MNAKTRIVIGGFGNVGEQLVHKIREDEHGTLEIAAIAARDLDKAKAKAEKLGCLLYTSPSPRD